MGGSWNDNGNAGLSYLYVNYAFGNANANVGFRLTLDCLNRDMKILSDMWIKFGRLNLMPVALDSENLGRPMRENMNRKCTSNLYDEIIRYDNIAMAIDDAGKTKKSRADVQRIVQDKDRYIKLLASNFHISGNYHVITRADASSGKIRKLTIPPFYPDQVIQHAVSKVCEPFIIKKFMPECCCSLKGRGTLYASMLVRKAIHHGARYFVKFDIRHYFDSIDQKVLISMMPKIFKDVRVVNCYSEIIHSVPSGIPIGNYTSQSLANLYMTPLDRYVKETLKAEYYARYMDDFIIMGASKRRLLKMIKPIKDFVEKSLMLRTHDDEKVQQIACRNHGSPIDFCGYRHYSDHTTIRRRIWKRLRRGLIRESKTKSKDRAKRIVCYIGYLNHSNSRNSL